MFPRLLIRQARSGSATFFQCRQPLCLSSSLPSSTVAAAAAPAIRVRSFNRSEIGHLVTSKRAMASSGSRDLHYDDIVSLSAKNEIILIDVREPAEIQETGKLPGSTHIPLGEVPSALGLDDAVFKEKYGIEKPGLSAPIVFSCRSGKRSNMALEKALALGFSKCRHYAGGWLDWEKNTK